MQDWTIKTVNLYYDKEHVEYAKSQGKIVQVGDILCTDVRSIGPIQFDHNHWTGWVLTLTLKQAEWIQKACEAYEKIESFPGNSDDLSPN